MQGLHGLWQTASAEVKWRSVGRWAAWVGGRGKQEEASLVCGEGRVVKGV